MIFNLTISRCNVTTCVTSHKRERSLTIMTPGTAKKCFESFRKNQQNGQVRKTLPALKTSEIRGSNGIQEVGPTRSKNCRTKFVPYRS